MEARSLCSPKLAQRLILGIIFPGRNLEDVIGQIHQFCSFQAGLERPGIGKERDDF